MFDGFYYNKNFKNIAVKFSGGADSTIVYYACCLAYPDANIYPITLQTDQKPFYGPVTRRIINKVYEKTGKNPIEHIIVFGKHNDYVGRLNAAVEKTIKKKNIDIVYSGMTINPPIEDVAASIIKNHERYNIDPKRALWHLRNRDKSRDQLTRTSSTVDLYTDSASVLQNTPFTAVDKKDVYYAYKNLNVLDWLFPLTNSCASHTDQNFTDLNNFNHCNHCFPCLERLLAFGNYIYNNGGNVNFPYG